MPSSDQIHRFIFDNTDIRGEIVTLQESLKAQQALLSLPKPVQILLGEFMAAATLMSSTLKFKGILTLQARGNGSVPTIMAEVRNNELLRGIATLSEDHTIEDDTQAFLPQLIGDKGILSITLDPDQGERYQGIVPLDAPSLAECIEHYFQQSEQLPTKIWLSSNANTASGLFIQMMPQQIADTDTNKDAWENRIQLANTITDKELLNLEHEQLLTRLFHEEGVRMFDPKALRFECSCSKARCSQALIQLGEAELHSIIEEQGAVHVNCQFCGFQYEYNKNDVVTLFAPPTTH